MPRLSDLPFYGAYRERQAQIEQEPMRELQQAQGVMTLSGLLQQQQDRARKAALEQQMMQDRATMKPQDFALKYAGADALLRYGKDDKGQSIGAGGLRLNDGTIVPPAARPQQNTPTELERLLTVRERIPEGTPVRRDIDARIARLTAPTGQQGTPLSRLMAERDALPAGDPRRATYDNAIRKESEISRQIAPPIVIPPQPQIVQTDTGPVQVDRSGNATPITINGEPVKPKGTERALPTSAAQKLMENNQNLRRAQQALELISGKVPEGDKAATGIKGFLPDAVLQRIDPEGVSTRAAIADLGSLIIHDRSGAAVTAAEFPRLRPFIPSATDDPATAKKKLQRFVTEYERVVQEAVDFYKESGYKVPDSALRATPKQTTPNPTATGPNGEKIEYRDGKWQPVTK